jgi:mannosyl-oligosaccharide alpha-1,2-mannosidase
MAHQTNSFTRRTLLQGGAAAGVLALAAPASAAEATDWRALTERVRAEMAWAFDAYRRLAWGADEIRSVSGTGKSFLIEGEKVGLSLIEALDTLWLMGLDAQLEDAVRWIKTDLTFDLDGDAQIFEATIRLVGGLLSGYLATGEKVLLEKAHDLAERMLPGYDTSTGMPVRYINLKTGKTRGTHSFPAEVGGGSGPEFVTLSRLTGDRKFADAAITAMLALYERRSPLGLIGDTIDVETGKWLSSRATIAPPSDAYYEYLWDTWRLTGDTRLRDAYATLTAAVKAHLADHSTGQLWFANVDFKTGKTIDLAQSVLSAFYAGLLSEGGDHAAGVANMHAWLGAQGTFGVIPESFDPTDWSIGNPAGALRPELADSALTLWLADRSDEWRHAARLHFELMKANQKAPHGYSGLTDITKAGSFDDDCPGYWWSEQMKYYWLIFSDCPRFDYRDNYLSTEGNVFKGFVRA